MARRWRRGRARRQEISPAFARTLAALIADGLDHTDRDDPEASEQRAETARAALLALGWMIYRATDDPHAHELLKDPPPA